MSDTQSDYVGWPEYATTKYKEKSEKKKEKTRKKKNCHQTYMYMYDYRDLFLPSKDESWPRDRGLVPPGSLVTIKHIPIL